MEPSDQTNVLTVHIHSDAGTQLRNLGDKGEINENGEIMRLIMLLKLQSISPGGGDKNLTQQRWG